MEMLSVPSSWETNKRKAPVGGRSSKKQKKNEASHYTFKTIQSEIETHLRKAPDDYRCGISLTIDDLFQKHCFADSVKEMAGQDMAESIAQVSKSYEEQYMRECKPGEEPCVMGDECECMHIDRSLPFVGTCFVLPTPTHSANNMCVLCLRRTTQLLFYRVVQQGIQSHALIQRHGNICNQEGEYHPSAMLICPPSGPVHCLPLPVVAHQRNRYSVVDLHGVKYMKQHGVGMTDFQEPPPPLSV